MCNRRARWWMQALWAPLLTAAAIAQDPPMPHAVGAQRPANRLAQETSPYLLQHAHNPVDWFAWGDDAFAEARRRNVPIFLSIGYSTCYWCHVMERESFEDEATGRLMSDNFVCIKVDREERPDIDDIYMTATTAMTGRGGWPMSVFLTPPGAGGPDDPGLKPFYCGTYFPPEPRHSMPAFSQVLQALAGAWRDQRAEVLAQADALAAHVRTHLAAVEGAPPQPIDDRTIAAATRGLLQIVDRAHGGFGGAPGQPKFPQPVFLEFLLDALPAAGDADTRAAIEAALRVTLDRMAMGGIHDHVGGGFHRYSVDERWLVPHFEKMLYDNAQLLSVYARASTPAPGDWRRETAGAIVAYIRREMTSPEGGFYSAQDAEVDGREGQNYLWTPEDIDAVFAGRERSGDDAAFARRLFGVDDGPNFQDPHHPGEPPSNVLFLAETPETLPQRFGLSRDDFAERVERVRRAMREARDRRKQPRLDDKIIASWNGLMIRALANAAPALPGSDAGALALGAATFAWERLRHDDGRLMRTWRAGQARTPAMLEDYAALIGAFAALHRLDSGGPPGVWLGRAEKLADEAATLFADATTGAYFDTRADQSDLIVRGRSMHDDATPSAQSLMLHALLDLHEATGAAVWKSRAERLLASMSGAIAQSPVGAINATRALLRLLRMDASAAERLATHAGAPRGVVSGVESAPPGPDAPGVRTPVGVFAATDRIGVRRGATATLPIELRIDEGWHITAHEPFAPDTPAADRLAGLIGLTVRLAGGAGLLARVDYPRGERLDGAEGMPPLLVHSGAVRLDIVLERTDAPWAGAPVLLVTYQACDDRACLEPMTVELDVAIDPE